MWLRPSHVPTPGSAVSVSGFSETETQKHGPGETRVCFYSGCNLPSRPFLLLENLHLYQKNKFQDVYFL